MKLEGALIRCDASTISCLPKSMNDNFIVEGNICEDINSYLSTEVQNPDSMDEQSNESKFIRVEGITLYL